jgi:LmbE family N-acetylglucosaminyl deacetylase
VLKAEEGADEDPGPTEGDRERFTALVPEAPQVEVKPMFGNLGAFVNDEGLEPWTVQEAWLITSPQREINHYVDITATFDRKVAAVRAHASQIKDLDTLADRLRQRIAPNTAAAGLPDDTLAEAFQVVVTG